MNDGQVRDFLGVQGGGPLPFIPTVQLADFSESAIGEFIEARGFIGATVSSTTFGDFPFIGLHSRAPGGCVISDFYLRVSGSAGGYGFMGVIPSQVPPGAQFDPVTVGSVAPLSKVFTNASPVGAFATGTVIPDRNNFRLAPGTRWYVPPGGFLGITTTYSVPGAGSILLECHFTWRELAPPTRGG